MEWRMEDWMVEEWRCWSEGGMMGMWEEDVGMIEGMDGDG